MDLERQKPESSFHKACEANIMGIKGAYRSDMNIQCGFPLATADYL